VLLCIFSICAEYAFYGSAGFALGVGIKVGINVGSRAHIAVPKPHLNDFHIDILCHQERCAGVAQVVEPNRAQSVLFQHLGKACGDIVRS